MKTVLFYHIYLDDHGHWSYIINEQFSCAENYGLLDNVDDIYVTCVSNDDYKTKWLSVLLNSYFRNTHIEEVPAPFSSDIEMLHNYPNFGETNSRSEEVHTLKKMYDLAQTTDMKALYFHARGITFGIRTLHDSRKKNFMQTYSNQYHKMTYLSRQFLNWGVIENWKKMHEALEVYDVAGVNYHTHPSKCFHGNFWWSKSSYIKQLKDPLDISWWRNLQHSLPDNNPLTSGFSGSDRFRAEFWICNNNNVKPYNLIDISYEDDPQRKITFRSSYANKRQNNTK